MADDQNNPLSAEPTWVVPVGALSFDVVVWLLVAGIQVLMFSEFGWLWLFSLRLHIAFIFYGWLVSIIRFFKITNESVTVYSWAGLRRKHIRLDSIESVYGRWGVDFPWWVNRWGREQYIPTVRVRCHDGQVITLNVGRLKLCRRLITEIRRRLPANGSQESSPRCVMSDLADPLQARLVEWILDYVIWLFQLVPLGLFLYGFLKYKGIL